MSGFLYRLTERGFSRTRWNSLTIGGGTRWLFECKIDFKWQSVRFVNPGSVRLPGQEGRHGHWHVSIILSFNLTRFIGLRGLPSQIDPSRSDLRTLFQTGPDQVARLHTLDQADNFIPSDSRLGEAQGANWPEEFGAFVRLIKTLLYEVFRSEATVHLLPCDFDRSADLPTLNLDCSDWAVQHIETYWEFYSPDALAAVAQFHARLPRLSAEIRAARYALATSAEAARIGPLLSREEQLHASLALSIPVGTRDAHTIVYAKHPKRIRFELRRSGEVRRTLARAEVRSLNVGGDVEGLVRFLRDIADDAAARMNIILRALAATRPTDVPSARTLAELLAHFGQACRRDPDLCEALLNEMLATGRLDPNGPRLRKNALRNLERSGVLERQSVTSRNHGGVFALSARYRSYASLVRAFLDSDSTPE